MMSVRDRVRAARIMCMMEDMYRRGCEDVIRTDDGTYIYRNTIEARMVEKDKD